MNAGDLLTVDEIRREILRLFDEGVSAKEIAFFCLINQVTINPGRYKADTLAESLRRIAEDYKATQDRVKNFLINATE